SATPASAILVVNNASSPDSAPGVAGFDPAVTKPMGIVSFNTGQMIKNQLNQSVPVTVRLFRAADRDDAIDNQMVFHEFFHYVSNRRAGNASGLGNTQGRGMGEGWSDFNALLLTVRENDPLVASNPTWNGTYPIGAYPLGTAAFDGSVSQAY